MLLNARAPGAVSAERNIYSNEANANANVQKNATSGAQALAADANNEAQANKSFENLSQQETQDYQRRFGNYAGAVEGSINEGDKVMQDKVRRFGDLAQIEGAQRANIANQWGSLTNLGLAGANFGLSLQNYQDFKNGKLPNRFGGGYGGGNPPIGDTSTMYNNQSWMQYPPYMINNSNTYNG